MYTILLLGYVQEEHVDLVLKPATSTNEIPPLMLINLIFVPIVPFFFPTHKNRFLQRKSSFRRLIFPKSPLAGHIAHTTHNTQRIPTTHNEYLPTNTVGCRPGSSRGTEPICRIARGSYISPRTAPSLLYTASESFPIVPSAN
jgi:hypothetical protein